MRTLKAAFSRVRDYLSEPNVAVIGRLYVIACCFALVHAAFSGREAALAGVRGRPEEAAAWLAAVLAGAAACVAPGVPWLVGGMARRLAADAFLFAAGAAMALCLPGFGWRPLLGFFLPAIFLYLIRIYPSIFLDGDLRHGLGALLWPLVMAFEFGEWLAAAAAGAFLGSLIPLPMGRPPLLPGACILAVVAFFGARAAFALGRTGGRREAAEKAFGPKAASRDLAAAWERLLWGESADAVTSLSLSPDGRTAAARTWAGGFRVHDAATGRLLWDLPSGSVRHTPLLGDGGAVLLAEDGALRLRDGEGRPSGTPVAVGEGGAKAAFSRDGTVAARLVANDGLVEAWSTATGSLLRRVPAGRTIYGLALSADGGHLALAGNWGAAVVDLKSGQEALFGQAAFTALPSFSPDGRILVLSNNSTCAWHWREGERWDKLWEGRMDAVAFSADGRLCAGAGHSRIAVWETRRWRRLLETENPAGARALAFSPDGRELLASAGARLWTLPSPVPGWRENGTGDML